VTLDDERHSNLLQKLPKRPGTGGSHGGGCAAFGNKLPNFLKIVVGKMRAKHLTIFKFLIVGVWNTIFGYLIYYLSLKIILASFTTPDFAYLWAMGIAQVVGTINAYVSHRKITFSDRARGKQLSEFMKFSFIYIITFSLTLILMPVFVGGFGISPELTGFIVICIGTAVSYLGHSRFTFKPK
jgi:putative flippase GtrA